MLLLPKLLSTIGRIEKSLDLVSPYFVPGTDGTASLAALAGRGVRVRLLTNSLAASDEKTVHAGYAKRRADLLRAGVRLYELKPDAATEIAEIPIQDPVRENLVVGPAREDVRRGRRRIFVGSFNFDQRSLLLNTEMGLVIDDPALAQGLGEFFDTEVPMIAYEVRLAPDGDNL